MLIRSESMNHYLKWMVDGHHFAFAGFSDAEWYCMMGLREGERTGLGQIISAEHGKLLFDVMKRRKNDERFLFAIPECIKEIPGLCNGDPDWFLGRNDIRIVGYERDRVTDDLAKAGKLYPFIRQLQDMNVVMIGPAPHRKCEFFLRYKHFVEIESPNLHLNPGGIERAVKEAIGYYQPAVYLVSAGVSAAVIIDRLYGKIEGSWFFDCGSMWDGFAKTGEQRQWRADLYRKPKDWRRWLIDCIEGKHSPDDGRHKWLRKQYPEL